MTVGYRPLSLSNDIFRSAQLSKKLGACQLRRLVLVLRQVELRYVLRGVFRRARRHNGEFC